MTESVQSAVLLGASEKRELMPIRLYISRSLKRLEHLRMRLKLGLDSTGNALAILEVQKKKKKNQPAHFVGNNFELEGK